MCVLSAAVSGTLAIIGIVLLVAVLILAIVLLVMFIKAGKHVNSTIGSMRNGTLIQSMIGSAMLGAKDAAAQLKARTTA